MTTNPMYDAIAAMVDEAMVNLEARCKMYVSPTQTTATGKPAEGIKALADDIGISRTNLQRIFKSDDPRQMSTWIFIKICQHLGIWPDGLEYQPTKELETQNVKTAMTTPRDPMMVCISVLYST